MHGPPGSSGWKNGSGYICIIIVIMIIIIIVMIIIIVITQCAYISRGTFANAESGVLHFYAQELRRSDDSGVEHAGRASGTFMHPPALRARSFIFFAAQFLWKICGELQRFAETAIFPTEMANKYFGVLRRFAKTTNPCKNCAEKSQNSGS